MKKRLLVTGGAGFIGNAIINKVHEKYDIVVLDNLSPQIHGENPEDSFLYNNIKDKCKVIIGDVCDEKSVTQALEGVDYIIHLAAETGTGQSMYEINKYSKVNILGLSNILETILKNDNINPKKIILSSSRSVYGEGMYECNHHGEVVPNSRNIEDMTAKDFEPKCPICHESVNLIPTRVDSKVNPISYYAFTKLAQEQMLQVMCPSMNLDYTIFRYQNVFGPGQSLNNPYTGILSIFSKRLLKNEDINIFEDGLESRDFVHVQDVASYTVNALENEKSNGVIMNVGSGESVSVIEVAETLKTLYGSESKITVTGDFRIGDIRHNKADMDTTYKISGFMPEYTFKTGMLEFSGWVKSELTKETHTEGLSFDKSIEELVARGMLYKGN